MFEMFTEKNIDEKIEKFGEWLDEKNLNETAKTWLIGAATCVGYASKGFLEGVIICGSVWGYIQMYKHFHKK